ncbi:MAG TPA: hypothetical protein DCR40_19750 [Prolixibacteraceae bacterium]|nr:hypothetical protein [Prolixibacteraceae bacterium]
MNMKILKGTVIGGIVYFLLGWLVYGILLADFSLANYNQCAMRPMTDMIWWAMIVSNLVYALFLTLVLKWSGASGWMDGLKTGALFGLLFVLAIDLSFYSMTTMFNSVGAMLIDMVVSTVMAAIIGTVIVLVWGKD